MIAFMFSRRWHPGDYVAAVLSMLIVLWLSVGSWVFLQPVAYTVDGYMVTFVRRTPFGAVTADYAAEIRIPGGQSCAESGRGLYEDAPADTVQYELAQRLRPCVHRGVPASVHLSWRVELWGLIPLRETTLTTLIER